MFPHSSVQLQGYGSTFVEQARIPDPSEYTTVARKQGAQGFGATAFAKMTLAPVQMVARDTSWLNDMTGLPAHSTTLSANNMVLPAKEVWTEQGLGQVPLLKSYTLPAAAAAAALVAALGYLIYSRDHANT